MTQAEKKMNSILKDLEKIQTKISRLEVKIQKNLTKCEKLGCADWTEAEWKTKREALMEESRKQGSMYIIYDDTMTEKQNEALWIRFIDLPTEQQELNRSLENTEKRLAKATADFMEVKEDQEQQEALKQKEESWISIQKQSKEEYEAWLKQFKAECLLDGVIIEEANSNWISGITKSGKPFHMYMNSGWTDRSFHCYTLKIDGHMVFTSGTFATAYTVISR